MRQTFLLFCLLLSFTSRAQSTEVGISGGVKTHGGYIGSVGVYQKIWKLQVAGVCEMATLDNNFKNNIFAMQPSGSYRLVAPGANLNYIIPIPRGYVYPGIAARYAFGQNNEGYRMKGTELGLHAGASIRLVKSLYANAEIGARMQTVLYDAQKMYFSEDQLPISQEVMPYAFRATFANVPVTVGLRWAF